MSALYVYGVFDAFALANNPQFQAGGVSPVYAVPCRKIQSVSYKSLLSVSSKANTTHPTKQTIWSANKTGHHC